LFKLVDGLNHRFEIGPLFAKRLCTVGFIPDVGLLKLPSYLFKTL
jgi:hypothetical protein